tara:strand:+ start:95 stop:304 length:210 start_codon:yes stop_codon:yes gene_type:complete
MKLKNALEEPRSKSDLSAIKLVIKNENVPKSSGPKPLAISEAVTSESTALETFETIEKILLFKIDAGIR